MNKKRGKRECRVCGVKKDLVYRYTREPSIWSGFFYCRKHDAGYLNEEIKDEPA